jgi:hypothetical protein
MLKPLTGHISPETAYVVEDYPYGFKLRCKIRYWLECDPRRGFRFCSQTTNPKKSVETWNAPKKSTYTMLGVMGTNEEGQVTWTGCSIYDFDKLEEFGKEYASSFDDNQRKVWQMATDAKKRADARKAAASPAEPIKMVDVTDQVMDALRRNNF